MHDVTAALSNYFSENRHTQQRQIADDVQNLVAHKLVAKSQASRIQHPVGREHNGVVEGAAADQVGAAQRLDFIGEAKGARGRYLATEGAVG